jgi:phage tail-like protein
VSRGLIADLPSPAPFGAALPAIYQEDDLSARLVTAFDEVIAPAFSTLDNFTAYIDPALAPDDFLDWLAGWVGLLLDETWPIERRRAFIALAAELYRARGTAAGLAAQVRLFTAGEVEIVESGGSAWSTTADAAAPGSADFSLVVRVKPPAKGKLDAARLDALVAQAKPAHVGHRVEVISRTSS